MYLRTSRSIVSSKKYVSMVQRVPFVSIGKVQFSLGLTDKVLCPPNLAVAESSVMEKLSVLPKLSFAPIYRVILIEPSDYPKQEAIDRLKRAVPMLDIKSVSQIVVMALRHGRAIVLTCMIEEAEKYAKTMNLFGLKSTIEQA